MRRLLRRAYRRRLYLLASFAILGLQICAYSALLILWATKGLDRHLFSLSRLSLVSQVISVTSQALAISSLAALTFFVQTVAADRIIRRPQKLAAIQDLLDAWRGIGSSMVSIWRSRRLGRRTHRQLLVVFLFFAVISVLQIVVPATVTVESTNSTIPVPLRVTQRPELRDTDFASLGASMSHADLAPTVSFLAIAVKLAIGIPPGVEEGTWFNTLSSSGPETVTFTDQRAQQPAVRCASIPRRSGDRYNISYKSHRPGSDELHANVTSLLNLYNGVVANFSNSAVEGRYFDASLLTGYNFGGEKASKEDPPNSEFNDTLLYLPLSPLSGIDTRNFGNIAFVLISSRNDVLLADSFGLDAPVHQTLNLTVWSWITNSTLTNTEKHRSAFQENVSLTFYYWPIACTMYLVDLMADVRGDNTLLSGPGLFNHSQAVAVEPFARPLPSSPYERAWGPLFDEIWFDELFQWATMNVGAPGPNWLERQMLRLLDGTTSTSVQKIAALQAGLQSITSFAYPLLIQHLYVSGSLTRLNATIEVQGQQQVPLAKLHVNGLQTVLGLLCVATLFVCVLYLGGVGGGPPREECYTVVGDVVDFVCLMRGSSLPELFAEPRHDPLTRDTRRDKAEKIDVVFDNFRLDIGEAKVAFPLSGFALFKEAGGGSNALAATERALARLSHIKQNEHRSLSVPPLTRSLFVITLALGFLCCIHIILIVLWACQALNTRYFDLSELGTVAQAIAVVLQIGTVGALGLFSYSFQRIAADKFIRQEQTVQDLQHTLGSLSGIASAFHALWNGFLSSRRLLSSVGQLCLLWLASSILHITMPALISVNTATVSIPVPVQLDTIPGNIIDLGANCTFRIVKYKKYVVFGNIFSEGLLDAISAVPYLWENRNAPVRLPRGLKETTMFSSPSNVSSGDYVITDPYAHSLSVRCGVIQPNVSNLHLEYFEDGVTPRTFTKSSLSITAKYNYTRPDGVTPTFSAWSNTKAGPGVLQFGGEKPSYNSPPNMLLRNILIYSTPYGEWDTATAERSPVSFFYISLNEDALSFPSGFDYSPPIKATRNLTVLSWVNDTKHPTTTLNGQLVNAFNESVATTFFIWPLACVLTADQATATVLGNGTLKSLSISDVTPRTAFPFMTNEPKNQLESNWAPLLGAIYTALVDAYNHPWLRDILQSALEKRPSITTLEYDLASISSLTYSLLIDGWRNQYAAADGAALAPPWVPQYAIVAGERPVRKAHLQVNGIPLLVGSLSVLVLSIVSVTCLAGHRTTDNIVRDGGVIDLVSLLHNSALPEILARREGVGGNESDALFMTRGANAHKVMVAYGYGSLDTPRRIQQREIEHLDALSRWGNKQSVMGDRPRSSQTTVVQAFPEEARL